MVLRTSIARLLSEVPVASSVSLSDGLRVGVKPVPPVQAGGEGKRER